MTESTDYYMYVSTYTQGDPKDRLKTEKRPKQVKEFLAYGQILGRRPQMKSVEEYGDELVSVEARAKHQIQL